QMRSIVNRPSTERRPGPRWLSVRLEEDPLIALAHQRTDAAVDILGATLLGDLQGLRLVNPGPPTATLQGRLHRAPEICKLLGRTDNPRSVRWLTSADDLVAGRPDLAEHFSRHELTLAMLRFPSQVKDRITTELETGKAAAEWGY